MATIMIFSLKKTSPRVSGLDEFWAADLETIQKNDLKGLKVTSLPSALDDRIPPQGSVLFDRTIRLKESAVSSWFFGIFLKVRAASRNF